MKNVEELIIFVGFVKGPLKDCCTGLKPVCKKDLGGLRTLCYKRHFQVNFMKSNLFWVSLWCCKARENRRLCAKQEISKMSAGIASLYIISQRCIEVPLCGTSVLYILLRYPTSCTTTCLLSSRSMQISSLVPFLPPHNTLPSSSLSGVILPTSPAC